MDVRNAKTGGPVQRGTAPARSGALPEPMLIQSPCVRPAAWIVYSLRYFSSEIRWNERLDSHGAPAENPPSRIGGLHETVVTDRRRHFAEPRTRVAVRVERLRPSARKGVRLESRADFLGLHDCD